MRDNNINFTVIEYLKEPINHDELYNICQILAITPIELVRTKDKYFKTLNVNILWTGAGVVTPGFSNNILIVKDPGDYADAWSDLIDAQVAAGNIEGDYGLRAHIAGSANFYTHYAFTGASSIMTAVEGNRNLLAS